MPTLNDDHTQAPAPRVGPRLAGAIVVIGVVLLMGFSIAASLWASNPSISVLAGTTAISVVAWVIHRVVATIFPGRGRDDDPQPPAQVS